MSKLAASLKKIPVPSNLDPELRRYLLDLTRELSTVTSNTAGKLNGSVGSIDASTLGGVSITDIPYFGQPTNTEKSVQMISSGDLNDVKASGVYLIAGDITNAPDGTYQFWLEHRQCQNTTNAMQTAIRVNALSRYVRLYSSGAWGSWVQTHDESGNPVVNGDNVFALPRGVKSDLHAVSWTINKAANQTFKVYQPVVLHIKANSGSGTIQVKASGSIYYDISAFSTTQRAYAFNAGTYKVVSSNVSIYIYESPSRTQADVIS